MNKFYTVTAKDVGKATIRAFGKRWNLADHFGPLQAGDWGKRIYQTSPGVLQIENDEQVSKRLVASGKRIAEERKLQSEVEQKSKRIAELHVNNAEIVDRYNALRRELEQAKNTIEAMKQVAASAQSELSFLGIKSVKDLATAFRNVRIERDRLRDELEAKQKNPNPYKVLISIEKHDSEGPECVSDPCELHACATLEQAETFIDAIRVADENGKLLAS